MALNASASVPYVRVSRGVTPGAPQGAHSAVVNVGSRGLGLGLTEQELENINNPKWLEVVIHWLSGFRNDTADFKSAQLRLGIEPIWVLIVVMYAVVGVLGVLLNVAACYKLRRGKHRGTEGTKRLLANVCAANLVQTILVMPPSVVNLLVQNWMFGSLGCYLLPMAQDVPLHVQMLTFSAVGYDRYKFHKKPTAEPTSPKVISCCLWIVSCLIVLPFPVYTTFLDLGSLIRDQLHGVGICILNLAEDMQEYVVTAFVFTFVIPVVLSAYFHTSVHCMLKRQANSSALRLRMYEERLRGAAMPAVDPRFPNAGPVYSLGPAPAGPRLGSRGESLQLEAEGDLFLEQRTQKFLVAMNSMFAALLLPIMCLRLLKHRVTETYANANHFDLAFCFVVFFAFLAVAVTPALVLWWISAMPSSKERPSCCFNYPKFQDDGMVLRPSRPSLLPPPPPHCPPSPIAALGGPRGSRGSVGPYFPADALAAENGQIRSAVV